MSERAFLRAVWGPAVVAAAFLGAGVVGFFSFAMGLLVGERVLWYAGYPLAAILSGVGATLAAAWTATLLAPDRSRTDLRRVLAWAVGGAVAGLALFYAMTLAEVGQTMAARIAPVVFLATAGAAFSALKVRKPHGSLRRDALLSVGLLLLIPVALYGLIGLACLVDQCGA